MNRWKNYIIPAFYHIRHNLSFAIFYVLGTALAFVFIAIVLQLVYSVVGNESPMVNADRIVQIGSSRDIRGKTVYVPAEEIESLMNEISGYELYAVSHSEFVDVFGERTLPEWIGVCVTILVMVVFSMLSTWYPAYRVTKVNPAVTLK